MGKIVKLLKNEQIVDVIKKIKTLKGDEVIFELPVNAFLFKNPHNFSLIKKSAMAMGKTVIMKTADLNGQSMIAKAGLLMDEGDEVSEVAIRPPVKVKTTKKVKFDDMGSSMPRVAPAEEPAPQEIKPRVSVFASRFGMGGSKPQPAPASVMPGVTAKPNLPAQPVKPSRVTGKFTKYFILTVVVVVLFVFGAAVLLPQARITVYARSEPHVRDMEVSVDTGLRNVNSNQLTVPGVAITKEISHTKNFPTTGVKLDGNKATGSIQLYNFTKNTLTLRASTTTLTVNGKKYSFTKDVTGLRPTARIGQGGEQEIDQSSLIPPVGVIAQEVGPEYNLAADVRLEIQNSALGAADVYAETVGSVTGGSSTQTKVMSQKDVDDATVAMQNELATLVEVEIANSDQTGVSLKILPSAVKSEILAKTANKEVGDLANDFDMTIIAKVTGVGFNQEDVRNLIIEKINAVLSEDKYLVEDDKQVLNTEFKAIDIDKGTGVLSVHFETTAAYRVENTNLSKILAGKDANEIQEILMTKPEIDRVDIVFWPFFVKKSPKFNGKIYIETKQSQSN